MSQQIQQAAFISLQTDFHYDALGGVGRLGGHSLEALAPGVRQSDRVPGPPQTIGRWFSKTLDALTPHSWRAQGKFQRSLEDFSARTGRLLGQLRNLGAAEGGAPLRQAAMRELAGLRADAFQMTSRGADYDTVLRTRVALNLDILTQENPEALEDLFGLEVNGELDRMLRSLDGDGQADMRHDLELLRDVLRERMPVPPGQPGLDGVDAEARLDRVEAREAALEIAEPQAEPEPPYESRFTPAALLERISSVFSPRVRLENALQERQATLSQLSGEASRSLHAALDEIRSCLDGLPADPDSFALVRERVDEQMRRSIQCATDQVCDLALHHMPEGGAPAGAEGQDYFRIPAEYVDQELDALESSMRTGGELRMPSFPLPSGVGTSPSPTDGPASTDPFRTAIRQARAQIQNISTLYGEMESGLDQMRTQAKLYQLSVLLRDLAVQTPPEGVSRRQLGETCDALIDALTSHDGPPRNVEMRLLDLRLWLRGADLPSDLQARFQSAEPELRQMLLEPRRQQPGVALDTSRSSERMAVLERGRALHQTVGDCGALLQQAGLSQADAITGLALRVTSQALALEQRTPPDPGPRTRALTELRASAVRFMAEVGQARIRAVFSAGQGVDQTHGGDQALTALTRMERALVLAAENAAHHDPSLSGVRLSVARGRDFAALAENAARACAAIVKPSRPVRQAFEQLSLCAASGRLDADSALREMLRHPDWAKPACASARSAVEAFLNNRADMVAERGQDQMLRFIANRMGHNIIPHDIQLGLDGALRMLINTDRQMGGAQGARWITLPRPDTLKPGKISTGVHRLDDLLKVPDNLTGFYPEFYRVMVNVLSGDQLMDFSLPE